jgi:hypothetical protein
MPPKRRQPLGSGFDHVATIRIPLRPVLYDLDFPGIFVRHDGDGQNPPAGRTRSIKKDQQ